MPAGSGPHDVSPAANGGVWFAAQQSGQLGLLDPATGQSRMIPLGTGSRPHGVITAADGAAWVTDSGRNALIRVDAATFALEEHPLPREAANADLNTAVIAPNGVQWFTGQGGWYGKLESNGTVQAFKAPRGAGPYGITATPNGDVYYASLAGNHVARIDPATGQAEVLEPPIAQQGARRVWSDASGRIWVSAWTSGHRYDPASNAWASWKPPGANPQPYAVYVDETGDVWLSDFGANALVRFHPATEQLRASRCRAPTRRCARSTVARTRCGARSPPPTSSSSCGAASSAVAAPPTVSSSAAGFVDALIYSPVDS